MFESRHAIKGSLIKLTLDECADRVGISRKSLEDYYYFFKKAKKLGISIKN